MEIVTIRLRPETKAALEDLAQSLGERPTETMRHILESAAGTPSDGEQQREVQLTDFQRMSLINQLDVLAAVEPGQQARYRRDLEILERGYSRSYRDVHPVLRQEMPAQEGALVSSLVEALVTLYRSMELMADYSPTRQLIEPVIRDDLYLGFGSQDGPAGRRMADYLEFLVDGRDDLNEGLSAVCHPSAGTEVPPQTDRYRLLTRLVARFKDDGHRQDHLLSQTSLVRLCMRLAPEQLGDEWTHVFPDARGHLAEISQLPEDSLRDTILDVLEEELVDDEQDAASGASREIVRNVPDEWFQGLVDAVIADAIGG